MARNEPGGADPAAPPAKPSDVPSGTPPRSFLPIALGFLVVTAGAFALGILVSEFLGSRPQLFHAHCAQVAQYVEAVLREQGVQEENISRLDPEPVQAGRALGTHHRIEARLAPGIDLQPLRDIVAREMAPQMSGVIRIETMPDSLEFFIGELRACTLTFIVPLPVAADEPRELRLDCGMLARALAAALIESGVAPEDIVVRAPEGRSSAEAYWTETVIDVVLPEGMAADALAARLQPVFALREADVIRERYSEEIEYIDVLRENSRCVRIACYAPGIALDTGVAPGEGEAAGEGANGDGEAADAMAPPLAAEDLLGGPPEEMAPPGQEALPSDAESTSAPDPSVGAEGLVESPRVAIILDDGGYGGETTEKVLALDPRLTLAILPYLPASTETARTAEAAGFEVMLHMPMQAVGEQEPFPFELRVGMNEDEIRQGSVRALESVPGAAGVNNHTGSAFTQDEPGMRGFLSVLRERGLFFVDSRTHAETAGYTLAVELGVPAAERSVFIDNTAGNIDSQFAKLMQLAKTEGSAIGIAHFRAASVESLQRLLPQLEEEGIELVHVSELVK